MLKSILIDRLSQKFNHRSVQDVADGVNIILDALSGHLSKGNRVEIRGFGSFNLHYLAPRNAHNPKTGTRLVVASKYRLHFKPAKELKERVDLKKSR